MNIIPEQDKEFIEKAYKRRVIVLAMRTIGVTLFFAAGFLLPAYIVATYKVNEIEESIRTDSAVSEYAETTTRAAQVNQKVLFVLEQGTQTSIAERVMTILASADSSIAIESVSYGKQGTTEDETRVVVTGMAVNRDSLRNFEKQVAQEPFVINTSIPVSNFAKDKDLPFTLTLRVRRK